MRVVGAAMSGQARRLGSWALAAGGVLASIALVHWIGAHLIFTELAALGPALPLVMLLTGLRYPLQTAGWRLALAPTERPPWSRSFAATLAGNALSYFTFAGPVAGEPTRALLLRDHTPVPRGIAAGAVERALYVVTGAGVTALGLGIAAIRLGHGTTVIGVTGVAVAAAIAGARSHGLRRNGNVRRTTGTYAVRHEGWRETLEPLWRTRRRALAVIALLTIGQHILLLAEAWVILHALRARTGIATVLLFESVTKTVNSLGTFVPAGAGIAEGGSALLAAGLGAGASVGLSLALVRRARASIWSALGIALLAVPGHRPSGRAQAWPRHERDVIGPMVSQQVG